MMPNLPETAGMEAYNKLTAQQAELQKLSGEIFSMQMAGLMASARNYLGSSKGTTLPGMDSNASDPKDFPAKKQELLTRAQEHCDYVRGLK